MNYPGVIYPQVVNHWETLVKSSDTWKYFPGTSQPSANWYQADFDDTAWLSGAGGIGYGDGDDGTIINNTITVYLRKEFTVFDTAVILNGVLHMDYDDSFIAYLNGNEIGRANIGNRGDRPAYDQSADLDHEAGLYQGRTPDSYSYSYNILRQGTNVLAIEVHNTSLNSSDLTSNAWLSAAFSDSSFSYQPIPDWFHPVTGDFSSVLPLVFIDTQGKSILDEERIAVQLRVIDNGPGMINRVTDTSNNYNYYASVELRGESTQSFPKKSYSLEIQDSVGVKINVPLMGLPEENDWILHGHYSDKTCLRYEITLKLARDLLGRYASRTRYCEVFLNNDYVGLYSLMEKVKQDKSRVDISKLDYDDIAGDSLTGGYIIKVDKVDYNDFPYWHSVPNPQLSGAEIIQFQYSDPDGWDLQPQQRQYIKDFIYRFESVLSSDQYLNNLMGYADFIDAGSFIDFLIVNEMAKNIDAYLFSTYMYKEKDSDGGKLFMGPVWDFDLGYSNVDYNMNVVNIPGWIYEDSWRMYWFRRMMTDIRFRTLLSCRWHSLRAGVLETSTIFSYIDSLTIVMSESINRNFERWPIIGSYVWPNYYIGDTYEQEVQYLKSWLSQRISWMDQNIPVNCIMGYEDNKTGSGLFIVYPNPFQEILHVKSASAINHSVNIYITDLLGHELAGVKILPQPDGYIQWEGNNLIRRNAGAGIYLVTIKSPDGRILHTGKILRKYIH